MRVIAMLLLLFSFGCASRPTTNAPVESAAYRSAVDQAFDDLQISENQRSPASEGLAQAATQNFSKTRSFEVTAYAKTASFPKRDRDPSLIQNLGEPVTFQYRIDRQGHCALGKDVVPAAALANCIQIEIKPLASAKQARQFIRIFMSPDYRVYGLSYHDVNSSGSAKSRRKVVAWDSTEPLSSDSLLLAQQVIPLDLPIYASNAVRTIASQIEIKRGARKGQTCSGWNIRYHNSFGSNVKADWCESDPWPTVVETDRYIAYLNVKGGG